MLAFKIVLETLELQRKVFTEENRVGDINIWYNYGCMYIKQNKTKQKFISSKQEQEIGERTDE